MGQPAAIQIGSHTIGTITLDETRIIGEGGPHDPRLVLPLTFTFYPMAASLVLEGFQCSLHANTPVMPESQYGPVSPVRLWSAGPHHVSPTQPTVIAVRIPLSLPLVTLIERRRHVAPERAFAGILHITGTVSWVAQSFNALSNPMQPSIVPIVSAPFEMSMGTLSSLATFDNTRIDDLAFRVTNVVWLDQVLPGLGITHQRLVELALPHVGGPFSDQVVGDFDAARRDYDAGLYRESIQKCRDIRTSVEDYFKALDIAYVPQDGKGDKSSEKYVYNIVQRILKLSNPGPQYDFLKNTWNAWLGLASAGHHARDYSAADGRACLYLAAVLLEYITSLFSPPPLGVNVRI